MASSRAVVAGGGGGSGGCPADEPSTSFASERRPVLAKPLHLQRIERAVKLDNFINFIHNYFSTPLHDDDDNAAAAAEAEEEEEESLSDIDDDGGGGGELNGGGGGNRRQQQQQQSEKSDRRAEKMRLYNFEQVRKSRRWLKNVLLSDTSESEDDEDNSPTEDDLQDWLRFHKLRQIAQAELNADPEEWTDIIFGTRGTERGVALVLQHLSGSELDSNDDDRSDKTVHADTSEAPPTHADGVTSSPDRSTRTSLELWK